jgi:hypothetical protein
LPRGSWPKWEKEQGCRESRASVCVGSRLLRCSHLSVGSCKNICSPSIRIWCVPSKKGAIFFNGRRRSRRQRGACGDFVKIKTRRIKFMNQFLGSTHRGRVCMRAFVNVCICTMFRKKRVLGYLVGPVCSQCSLASTPRGHV